MRSRPYDEPSHAAALAGNLPSTVGALASRTSPSGSGSGRLPVLSTQRSPLPSRANASASGAISSQSIPSPANSARLRRISSARWKNDNVESASASCFSTVSAAHSGGIGNQVSAEAEKPNGGVSPRQGIGVRHPSRPRTVWSELAHGGAREAPSGNP